MQKRDTCPLAQCDDDLSWYRKGCRQLLRVIKKKLGWLPTGCNVFYGFLALDFCQKVGECVQFSLLALFFVCCNLFYCKCFVKHFVVIPQIPFSLIFVTVVIYLLLLFGYISCVCCLEGFNKQFETLHYSNCTWYMTYVMVEQLW